MHLCECVQNCRPLPDMPQHFLSENQAKIFNKFSINGTSTRRRRNMEEGDTRNLQTSNTYLRGYGCDGIDNDNSGQVDDCAEDVFPATLLLNDGGFCSSQYYLSAAELQACVERYLVAEDDCDTITAIEAVGGPAATCANTTLLYRAKAQRCESNNVEETLGPFKLDLNPPTLQPLNCSNATLPHTLEMIDLGPLGIVAADDCGIETITVKVTSDEAISAVNAQIYKGAGQDYGVVLRAHSLTNDTCNPLETDCNQVCFDGRTYTITVKATDVAGRTVSQTCVVSVALPNGYTADPACPEQGTTYLLAMSDAPYLTQPFCTQAEYFRLLDLGATDLIPPAGYGCNGINDNCDDLQQIDECAEDVFGECFPPESGDSGFTPTFFWSVVFLFVCLSDAPFSLGLTISFDNCVYIPPHCQVVRRGPAFSGPTATLCVSSLSIGLFVTDAPLSFSLRHMGPITSANRGDVVGEHTPQSYPLVPPIHTHFPTAPTINSEVAIAKIREKWFTNETELLTLLQGTVDILDDCGLATYTNITLFQACRESTVTLEIEDRCGNAAMEVIPVWFDSTPPTILATLENSVLDSKLDFCF